MDSDNLEVISDGEFVHRLNEAVKEIDRALAVKMMVLRKITEIAGLINTAMVMSPDQTARNDAKMLLAKARDGALEGINEYIRIKGIAHDLQITVLTSSQLAEQNIVTEDKAAG